jgi:hypothetical protein
MLVVWNYGYLSRSRWRMSVVLTKVDVVEKWFWVSWSNDRIFLHFYPDHDDIISELPTFYENSRLFYRSHNKETPKLPITRTDIQLDGKWTQFLFADMWAVPKWCRRGMDWCPCSLRCVVLPSLIMLITPSTLTHAEFGVCVYGSWHFWW